MGDTQHQRAVLRGLVLHLMAVRYRLARLRQQEALVELRSWQRENREAWDARQRVIEQAKRVPDPVRARQRGADRAAH